MQNLSRGLSWTGSCLDDDVHLLGHVFEIWEENIFRLYKRDTLTIIEYEAEVYIHHKSLPNVWATVDGSKSYLPLSGKHESTKVLRMGTWSLCFCWFLFCLHVMISICFYNFSDLSMTVANGGNIHEKLENVDDRKRAKCKVDSAFSTFNKVVSKPTDS